jgi:hypothetical protein
VNREHLKRKHRKPIQCPRCKENQASQPDLDAHLRKTTICAIDDHKDEEDGISRVQLDRLGEKGLFASKSEEEKWRVIWVILFGEDAFMPSPCKFYQRAPTWAREMSYDS